jgi:hypothetical protein
MGEKRNTSNRGTGGGRRGYVPPKLQEYGSLHKLVLTKSGGTTFEPLTMMNTKLNAQQ